jgi:hypothetical protein
MYNEKVFFEGLPKCAFGKHYNVEVRSAARDIFNGHQSIITFNSKLIAENENLFMFMSESGGIDLIYKERVLSMICTEKPKHGTNNYKNILDEYLRKSTKQY